MHQRTIAELAYALWLSRGSPEGSADVDWAEAERQIMGARQTVSIDASGRDSSPANDAAVISEQKWTAVPATSLEGEGTEPTIF
jgi:hypothetical protein